MLWMSMRYHAFEPCMVSEMNNVQEVVSGKGVISSVLLHTG